MKKTTIFTFLFSAAMFFSASGAAKETKGVGEDISIQDTINLNELVVTATRTPKMLKDVPQLTRVISRSMIDAMGDTRIEDILQKEFAGAEFHQAGYGTTMSIQGLDARYILVMLDGERLAGETYGNIDFSRIPSDLIERIEIVKGASSVLYGSNAMGATVNIITRNPKKKAEVIASARFGGYYGKDYNDKTEKFQKKLDLPNVNGNIYAGFNIGKFKSVTNINYQSIDAYKLRSSSTLTGHYSLKDNKPYNGTVELEGDTLSISGWQSVDISQRFTFNITKKVEATVKGGLYWKNRYDFPENNNGIIDGSTSKPWEYENYYGYNIKLGIDYNINEKNRIEFSLYDDRYYRRNVSEDDTKTPKQRHEFIIPRIVWTNTPDRINRITVGMEGVSERLNYDLTEEGYDTRHSFNTFSIFAQDEIQATKRFAIVAGLRVENFGFTDGLEFLQNYIGKPKYMKNISVTPKLSLTYNFNLFTVRANYAMGYRNPSLKERYMTYYQPNMGMTIKGNPDLKAESNNYISVSGEYTSKKNNFNTSLNLYANYFRDKIDVFYQKNESTGKGELVYNNIDKNRIYGIEWTGNVRLLDGWWLRANYSYVDMSNDNSQQGSTQYIYTSPHTATLQTNYSLNINRDYFLTLNLSASYIGSKEYEERVQHAIIPPGGGRPTMGMDIYNVKLPAYAIGNFSASVQFLKNYTVSAGINNFTNYKPKFVSFNSAVTPGVNGFVQLRVAF